MRCDRKSVDTLRTFRARRSKKGYRMKGFIQKFLLFLVIAFCLFYLITRPEDAANAVRGFFGAFESLVTFFTTLAAG